MGGCSSALLVPSGERYEGKWYHGNKIGEGKYYYKDGSVYEGNFFEDRRHGKGTMNFANGDVYKGDWRYNVIAGCGELVNKNGDVYVGFFEAGKPCGFGRMQYSDKSSFMCNWRNGLPNGDGQCVTAAGGVYVGGLNDGEFEGQGQLVLATGEVWLSAFRSLLAPLPFPFPPLAPLFPSPPARLFLSCSCNKALSAPGLCMGRARSGSPTASTWPAPLRRARCLAGARFSTRMAPSTREASSPDSSMGKARFGETASATRGPGRRGGRGAR